MRIEREYTDGTGKRFRAVATISEQGSVLEDAIRALANKARSRPRQTATALGGLVHVVVHPVIEQRECPCANASAHAMGCIIEPAFGERLCRICIVHCPGHDMAQTVQKGQS